MSATVAGIPLVVATGTPSQIGVSYGAQAADRVNANVRTYAAWFGDAGLDIDAVRARGAGFRQETERRWPRIAAMLHGVAEGAGCAPDDIFALNARTELLADALPGFVDGGCTTIGVLPARTREGHTLLAQNWDWQPAQREAVVVLATRDECDHAVVTVAEAGMLAKAGLNGSGIGACVNLLGTDRDGRPGGVPYHVLLRAVLEARTFPEAVLAAVGPRRSASINVLVGARSGDIVDLEVVPGDAAWLWPSDGVITHANHVEGDLPVVDKLASYSRPCSEYRAALSRRLLPVDGVDGGHLQAALQHHGEHSICYHADAVTDDPNPAETLVSVVLDLDDASMAVTPGPPCRNTASTVRLADLFGE